jgi:hypothetical protein
MSTHIQRSEVEPDPDVNGSQASDAERHDLHRFVDLALKVVGPTSLVTALLFYFGWARTQASLRVVGLHESLMDYSVPELLLRSVSALYLPLWVIGVGAIIVGALWARARLVAEQGRSRPWVDRAMQAVMLVAVAFVIFGSMGLVVPAVTGNVPFVTPIALMVGLLGVGLAVLFRRALGLSQDATVAPPVVVVGFAVLVILATFYATSEYAGWVGATRARQALASPSGLPAVSLLSSKSLHIDVTDVDEEELGASGYRYRYTGLRLLIRNDSHYVFLHDGWDRATGQTILVPVDDVERLDITVD